MEKGFAFRPDMSGAFYIFFPAPRSLSSPSVTLRICGANPLIFAETFIFLHPPSFCSTPTPRKNLNNMSSASPIACLSSMSGTHCRVLIRVRPMLGVENTTAPESSPVPRGIVSVAHATSQQPVATLTLLDPMLKFRPKKAGQFPADEIVSDFLEPTAIDAERDQFKAATLGNSAMIYTYVGADLVDSLMEGYHCGLVVCGGPKTGKHYTLFGEAVPALTGNAPTSPRTASAAAPSPPPASAVTLDSHNVGLVWRFAEQLFMDIQRKPSNTRCAVEIECYEIQGETIVDLLKPKLPPPRSPGLNSSASSTDLKLREEADMTVSVVNGSRTTVEDAASMAGILRPALRGARKLKSSHLVLLVRLTEHCTFSDPKSPGNSVSKSHTATATFALVSGAPTTFFRCTDTAAKRDAGDLLCKVPARDSSLTRLLSQECFGGNMRSSFVGCVSPYFDHVKDTVTTLNAVCKMCRVKHTAKLVVESQTLEFRRLEDQVKGLENELTQTHSARQVVQEELDRRQRMLEELSNRYEEQNRALSSATDDAWAENLVLAVKRSRLKRQLDTMLEEEVALDDQVQELEAAIAGENRKVQESEERLVSNEAEIRANMERHVVASSRREDIGPRLKTQEDRREFVASVRNSVGVQHQAMLDEHHAESAKLEAEKINEAEKLAAIEKQQGEVQPKHKVTKLAFDVIVAQKEERDSTTAEVKKLTDEEAALKEDIATLEKEVAALEEELNKPEPGCCVVS